MAKSDLKTKVESVSINDFISKLAAPRVDEARVLVELYERVSRLPPKMWGPSIIGFGSYRYKYESGREGEMCRAGFSPRKDKISIYLMGGYSNEQTGAKIAALRTKLGKHKTGASCLYINKLADVDIDVLRQMIETDLAYMNKAYPT